MPFLLLLTSLQNTVTVKPHLVLNALQWPIEKKDQVIWDTLQGYGRIKWKRTITP